MTINPPKTYFALALDPIHVGAGGYRLGEVDLTILREPGTNLPKIPGSSLEGSARAYTAIQKQKYRRADHRPVFDPTTKLLREPTEEENQSRPTVSCAGKGGDDGSEHCGRIDCPVCVSYGFTIGTQNRSFHGLAQFYDARILFFPVHSLVGPVWITCPLVLKDAGVERTGTDPSSGKVTVSNELGEKLTRDGINLGWIFLEISSKDLNITTELSAPLDGLKKRVVLVPDELFSQVVNSNLEVRTSVSIDTNTGAAKKGALFTYEALPRSTVLWFQIMYLNPHHYLFPAWDGNMITPTKFNDGITDSTVKGYVEEGMKLMEYLGVGGMSTRGFGRLRIFPLEVNS